MSPYFILMIQPSIAVILVENQRYHSKNNRNNKYFTVFFIFTFILQHVLAVSSIKPLFCTYFYKILYHKCKKNSSTNYVKNKWRSVDRHLLICSIIAGFLGMDILIIFSNNDGVYGSFFIFSGFILFFKRYIIIFNREIKSPSYMNTLFIAKITSIVL